MNPPDILEYVYAHAQTTATTGYFSCDPAPLPVIPELLRLIAERPLDSFLRRHALSRLTGFGGVELASFLKEASEKNNSAAGLRGLALELALLKPELAEESAFHALLESWQRAEAESPLPYLRLPAIRPEGRANGAISAGWAAMFRENICNHRALPEPQNAPLPAPPLFKGAKRPEHARSLPELHAEFLRLSIAETGGKNSDSGQPGVESGAEAGAAQVAELALQFLQQAGITEEGEMRHQASLSPIGLLRPWKLNYSSLCGRNRHTMRGQANTYGRGLGLPEALASCRMEMVERASAYASVAPGPDKPNAFNAPDEAGGKLRVQGLQAASFNFAASDNAAQKGIKAGELVRGSFSALQAQGLNPLDPNSLYLEAPYTDSPLYWLKAQRLLRPALPNEANGENGEAATFETVLVPFQAVYLFSNLDEADLAFAPPSTGLATFSTLEGAKLAALTELLEREAEATTPFSKQSCFTLESADPQIAALLQDYKARGINVQFQDLSGELGFPCYQAFVTGARGQVYRGYGAGLSARKAIISALTETPYPYPESAPSGPALRKLPVKTLESLPDYTIMDASGSIDRKASLALLETLFYENGLAPVYVELTRADLKFPVIRALAPGLIPTAEYDEYSQIPARLYRNYLRLFDNAL